jgi:cytochrome b
MTAVDNDMVTGRATRPQTIRVWDLAVRVFHWSLVAAMAYEFLFRAGTNTHDTVGYVILTLIGFRIVWGFVGTRHARFADFVKSPIETLRYIFGMLRGHPARYIGHNPAGAAMVLALLAMIILTAGSGWAMTTDALWGEEWIEELHKGAANLTLVLIAFHVLGVILASWQHRENLVRAMLTGRKSV